MKIISLHHHMKKVQPFDHELLKDVTRISDEDLVTALDNFPASRDEIIMGMLYHVQNIVGGFLCYWPETQRLIDDMVSEGVLAVTQYVSNYDGDISAEDFRTGVWNHVKNYITDMINDNRSTFSASRATNVRLTAQDKDTEYTYAKELREGLDAGCEDDGIEFVDMLDELEHLTCEDKEHFRTLILGYMKDNHGIDEDDLSPEELEAINNLSKLVSG